MKPEEHFGLYVRGWHHGASGADKNDDRLDYLSGHEDGTAAARAACGAAADRYGVLLTAPTESGLVEEEGIHPVIAAWNASKCFAGVRAMTAGRTKHLRARLRDPFWKEHWRAAIERLTRSDFCTGKNDRGWTADIDWFLKPDTVAKIMEGKYDSRAKESPAEEIVELGPPCPDWRQRAARLDGKAYGLSWLSHEKADISLRERLLRDMASQSADEIPY